MHFSVDIEGLVFVSTFRKKKNVMSCECVLGDVLLYSAETLIYSRSTTYFF